MIYVWDNTRDELVPKQEQRSRNDDDLSDYVAHRRSSGWDLTQGEVRPLLDEDDDEDEPIRFSRGSFRIRASDALDIFDKALGSHWDRVRLREKFEATLSEHVDGWEGERALAQFTKGK